MRTTTKLATAALGSAAPPHPSGAGLPRPPPRPTATRWRPCTRGPQRRRRQRHRDGHRHRHPHRRHHGRPGLLADSPHAAHIHFGADARHECPTASDDAKGDGTLNTTDGGPAYGPIVVSLTKTGDTSPNSGLAVDRFDTAPGGKISYERGSIKVSSEVARRSPTARPSSSSTAWTTTTTASTTATPRATSTRACPPRPPTRPSAACSRAAPAGGMDTGCGRHLRPPNASGGHAPPRWRPARSPPPAPARSPPARRATASDVRLPDSSVTAAACLPRRSPPCCSASAAGSWRESLIAPGPPPQPRRRLGRPAAGLAYRPARLGDTPPGTVPTRRARRTTARLRSDHGAQSACGAADPLDRASTPRVSSTSVSTTRASSRHRQDFDAGGVVLPRARPRGVRPAVIGAHVDSKLGPAVFYRLGSLKKGATVLVERKDGSTATLRRRPRRALPQGAVPHLGGLRRHQRTRRAAAHHLRGRLRPAERPLRRQHRRLRPPRPMSLTPSPAASGSLPALGAGVSSPAVSPS